MPSRKGRKGKQAAASRGVEPKPAASKNDSDKVPAAETPNPPENEPPKEPPLVLTSDKRRGVYECDYCHADISQVPRIRCAVCVDFDLCLECFSSADHAAAIASLKAVQGATNVKVPDHNDTHGYRVADSTRYVLFPPSNAVVPSRPPSCVDSDDGQQQQELQQQEESVTVGEATNEGVESAKDGDTAMEEDVSKDVVMEDSVSNVEQKEMSLEKESETGSVLVVQEDARKFTWTVEEDLRLLDAIKTCGLGNWADIAETISGQGSSNKTPKRCMERYLDDYLGRYGQILPPYTVVEYDDADEEAAGGEEGMAEEGAEGAGTRQRSFKRSYSTISIMSQTSGRKKKKVMPTSSLPEYQETWPNPYVPPIPNVEYGQDVGRVAHARAEQAFVKEVTQAASKEEADKIREEWKATRLNKVDGPTALPMRAEDTQSMKGAELAGYMPRRGDFDMEWDNEAETVLADMEFLSTDTPQDRQLKIQIIEMYNSKLDERERRKQFLLSRNLVDYRKNQKEDEKLPRDERDLVRRMRLFERLHTPEEHENFISDILKAKRLRKEIAKLQMYRRMGITSLAEAEKFELDKSRREFHKLAYMQKEAEAAAKAEAVSAAAAGDGASFAGVTESSSYWKEYRTTRGRRSTTRTQDSEFPEDTVLGAVGVESATATKPAAAPEPASTAGEETTTKDSAQAQKPAGPTMPDKERKGESFIVGSPGYELLSSKEVALCEKVGLLPAQYLEVKSALIQEALAKGVLDKATSKRTIVKIDVEKQGEVIDFMVRAGWVSSKRTDGAGNQRQSTTASSTTVND
jgi:hypothetical protein